MGDGLIDSPCWEWQHSLGEVLTALLDTGLRPTSFAEHRETTYEQLPWMVRVADGLWRLPFLEDSVPLVFTLTATK